MSIWSTLYTWVDDFSTLLSHHLPPDDPWLFGALIVGTTATLLILSYYDTRLVPGSQGEVGPVRFHIQFLSSDISFGAKPDSSVYQSCKVGTLFGQEFHLGWGGPVTPLADRAELLAAAACNYPYFPTLFRIGLEFQFTPPTPPSLLFERRLYPWFLKPDVDAGQAVLREMGHRVGYAAEPIDPAKKDRFVAEVMARARRVEEEIMVPLDNTNFPINSPYEAELSLLPPALLLLLLLVRLWIFFRSAQPFRLWIRYLLLPRLQFKRFHLNSK